MKRYDLILVAIYLLATLITLNEMNRYLNNYRSMAQYSKSITENQSINSVVINNTTSKIYIYRPNEEAHKGTTWAIRGVVSSDQLKNITIEDKALHIDGIEGDGLSGVIKLSDSVHLDIINSPNVEFLTDEEFAQIVINNTKRYDF